MIIQIEIGVHILGAKSAMLKVFEKSVFKDFARMQKRTEVI